MAVKKHKQKKLSSIILFIIIVLIIVAIFLFCPQILDKIKSCDTQNNSIINSDDLSIHFMEVGNQYTGDAVYIKAGETDILIDAGSRKSSASDITQYLNKYVADNKLEYVIVTHGHQDHIAGFVGTTDAPGIFDAFKCDTIIDFPLTNSNTKIVKDYYAKRDAEVDAGATHYNALDCYQNKNGAKRTYQLSEGIELEILYNYFYENKSTDENNYSVCVQINQGERRFLFTGDLEKEGEEHLVKYNQLSKVEVFKGGHHGSKTSSNECLLSIIKPKIVCVCCCAGSDEYTTNNENMFPTQAFVDRISKYTDKVYVTTIATDDTKGFASFNGNIVVSSKNNKEVIVECSNNNTILKDSEWFKKNRVWR